MKTLLLVTYYTLIFFHSYSQKYVSCYAPEIKMHFLLPEWQKIKHSDRMILHGFREYVGLRGENGVYAKIVIEAYSTDYSSIAKDKFDKEWDSCCSTNKNSECLNQEKGAIEDKKYMVYYCKTDTIHYSSGDTRILDAEIGIRTVFLHYGYAYRFQFMVSGRKYDDVEKYFLQNKNVFLTVIRSIYFND